MFFLISFCSSIVLSQFQAQLFSIYALLIIAALTGLFAFFAPVKWRLLAQVLLGLSLGLLWSNGFAAYRLQQVLKPEFEQQPIELLVQIDGIPQQKQFYQRTRAQVLQAPQANLSKIQLDWYSDYQPQACETWRVVAKLKRPHGLRNPGVWSYQQYLLQQNLQATGYVQQAERVSSTAFCLHQLRFQWQQYVSQHLPSGQAAWLVALSIGEKSLISSAQYQFLQLNGINHLFVISGLHIGLCASVVYGLLLWLLRFSAGLVWAIDWRPYAMVMAMLAAFAYAALADFVIPAQRALLMLLVFFTGQLFGVKIPVWRRYFLAMALVLLIDPLAAMNIGFALSFLAVALLIICAEHLRAQPAKGKSWRLTIASQFYIGLGLSPLLLLVFQQTSVLGPWVNLLAIPLVSLLVVPLNLLAFLLWLVLGHDFQLLQWANSLLQGLFQGIEWFNQYTLPVQQVFTGFTLQPLAILLLAASVAVLFLPKLILGRYALAGLLLIALVFLPQQNRVTEGSLNMDVLDVGQGLSVLIRTANHQMLYDTGPAWADGSMAQQVVLPVMYYLGAKSLDRVMLSHFDNDHAGGWQTLYDTNLAPQWLAPSEDKPFQFCHAGMTWRWDQTVFTVLSPEHDFVGSANDGSCVLLIEHQGRRILLPGDIGKYVEIQLFTQGKLPTIDVLVAAHHGSKTSSSYALINQLKQTEQATVIFTTGYRNRYNHPSQEVVQRFKAIGAQLWDTALHGMISVNIDSAGNVITRSFRQQSPRYWDKPLLNHLEY